MKKRNIAVGFIILCAVIFIVYVLLSIYGSPIEKVKFSKECQRYLSEAYSEEMKIIDIEYSFKTRQYLANVSLDNTDITFTVVKGKDKLSDNYFMEYWKHETCNDITEFVHSVYGADKGAGSLYFTQGSPISNSEYKKENKVPAFCSVRDKFNTSIFGFVDIYENFNMNNSAEEYKKIYQVTEYMFKKYLPKKINVRYSDNTEFSIDIESFKQLKSEIDIQQYER